MVKKLTLLFLGLLALGSLILVAWYRIDGIPVETSEQYMSGKGYTAVEEADGGLLFTPDSSNGHGIVIMHGALIKPKSYTKTAA